MSWYNLGTVTMTTGSAIVDGAGTSFVGNAIAGQALLTPDGRLMEIAEIISATRLRLVRPYAGGSVGGVVYDIIPTSADLTTVIERLNTLITRYRSVVDGIGQGLFPDGTQTAPGFRFMADPDTGFRRVGEDGLAVVTGGADRMTFTGGNVAVGGSLGDFQGVAIAGQGNRELRVGQQPDRALIVGWKFNADIYQSYAFIETFAGNNALALQTAGGNLLVGINSNPYGGHMVARPAAVNTALATFYSTTTGQRAMQVQSVDGEVFSGSGAALYVGRNSSTGRSGNFGGTINASGADYAEYMTKATGCGTIAKGDVCGVDRDGLLTKMWADAISFVIKSTDPSYVGGDIWGRSVGPRPEGPGEEPVKPIAPPAAPASEDEADVAAWRVILAAYPEQLAAYQAAHTAWATAKDAYDTALSAWEAALEVERQKVDRVAFSGQVPVNVSGDFAVGDYLIAAPAGAGIKAIAVPADTITFDQYRRRLGKVWAVRDGRAWVDVQHG